MQPPLTISRLLKLQASAISLRRQLSYTSPDPGQDRSRPRTRLSPSKRAGAAAALAEQPKYHTYATLVSEESMNFCPIGIDCTGALGPGAKRAISHIAGFTARQRGSSAALETKLLTTQLVSRLFHLQADAISRRRQLAHSTDSLDTG